VWLVFLHSTLFDISKELGKYSHRNIKVIQGRRTKLYK